MKTVKHFCAAEQLDTDHTLDINGSGDIVLTCASNVGTKAKPVICGRFIKYPKGTTLDELKDLMAKHKFNNEGQLPVEKMEKEKNDLIDALVADQ